MAEQSSAVARYGHGSRIPGWDDSVDLGKDPAVVPDPATTPVPDELRTQIEAAMAKYPELPLGRDPGAARGAGPARLVLAGPRSSRSPA